MSIVLKGSDQPASGMLEKYIIRLSGRRPKESRPVKVLLVSASRSSISPCIDLLVRALGSVGIDLGVPRVCIVSRSCAPVHVTVARRSCPFSGISLPLQRAPCPRAVGWMLLYFLKCCCCASWAAGLRDRPQRRELWEAAGALGNSCKSPLGPSCRCARRPLRSQGASPCCRLPRVARTRPRGTSWSLHRQISGSADARGGPPGPRPRMRCEDPSLLRAGSALRRAGGAPRRICRPG